MERPRLRDAQREFTRQLLMEVAIEVFEAVGYANATVEDIAKAARATRATFYQYFDSKRDIIAAIVERMRVEGTAMLSSLLDQQPLTRESVHRWLTDVAAYYAANRALMRATLEATAGDRDLSARTATAQQGFIALLAEHLADVPGQSAEVRATLLEAQREAVMQWWIIRGWPIDGDGVIEQLTDSWSQALGAPPE
jgi:AcrR family transcriptional regulator